jgi:hypothetical protein
MDFSKLKQNNRYLFYQKNRDGSIKYFRANYIGFHTWKKYKILVVCKYENSKFIRYIMDGNDIINAKSLVDIIDCEKCKLNDDVLHEINSFY